MPASISDRSDPGGRLVPEPTKFLSRYAIAQFRLVAEREQRLLAIRRGSGARDAKHLIAREIGSLAFARRMRKCAVVTNVPAELGQRNEDLAGPGDDAAVHGVAPRRRRLHQPAGIGNVCERQRIVAGKATLRREDRRGEDCHERVVSSMMAEGCPARDSRHRSTLRSRCAIPLEIR
jgi:hypothetical protein